MLFVFPPDTFGIVVLDYDRPYENPLAVKRDDIVHPVTDGVMKTDLLGWVWCQAPDGRAGWVPQQWFEQTAEGWRALRDFSALELTVKAGDRLRLLYSESGFLFCETTSGARGWVPDGAVIAEEQIPS
jgi:hypothetical protein